MMATAIRIDEYLDLRDGQVVCRKCERVLCRKDESYKLHVVQKEGPVTEAGPLHEDSRRFIDRDVVFRRFICPGCGTLLETEVVTKETPPIWDKEIL